MSCSVSGPVYESTTVPSADMKNDVGMYWYGYFDESCWADGSSAIALTNATVLPYSGTTLSATAVISRHDCQLVE